MDLLILAIIVATSLWVALDARKNGIPTHGEGYGLNSGALAWFLGCLLLWIVVFPYYWFRRGRVLRERRKRASAPPAPAASQVRAAARFCPHCGSPAQEGSRFCPSCGKEL
jgi:hypothetical protein